MQCLWVAVNDELEADTHDGHLRENKSGLYITSDCCVTLCFSVRADSSSQNPKGNNSGKNHGFLYQNVGNDKREEPLHTEGKARCTINDNTAHHVLFITKKNSYTLLGFQGSSEELPLDQQIGHLLTSENRQLELHLCKTVTLVILSAFICKATGFTKYISFNKTPFCMRLGKAIRYCFTK